jgi:hypothetical protein
MIILFFSRKTKTSFKNGKNCIKNSRHVFVTMETTIKENPSMKNRGCKNKLKWKLDYKTPSKETRGLFSLHYLAL